MVDCECQQKEHAPQTFNMQNDRTTFHAYNIFMFIEEMRSFKGIIICKNIHLNSPYCVIFSKFSLRYTCPLNQVLAATLRYFYVRN